MLQTPRLNWTKVGLKAPGSKLPETKIACLNWTKVGLKGSVAEVSWSVGKGLNWTKVGLKDLSHTQLHTIADV